MDLTLPQTPKMLLDFVPMHLSLRESPAKLRREIEGLEVKIEKEGDELKMLDEQLRKEQICGRHF